MKLPKTMLEVKPVVKPAAKQWWKKDDKLAKYDMDSISSENTMKVQNMSKEEMAAAMQEL